MGDIEGALKLAAEIFGDRRKEEEGVSEVDRNLSQMWKIPDEIAMEGDKASKARFRKVSSL